MNITETESPPESADAPEKGLGVPRLVRLWREGNTETGYGEAGIILDEDAENGAGSLISLRVTDNGKIELREECDGYFTRTETPEDAVAIFREAIEWIKANVQGHAPADK